MNKYHTIFIGGGINNLVAASLLAKSGKPVLVLERTNFLGGCVRSEEVKGCVIDTLSTAYPLFVTSPVFEQLKDDLYNEGVEFVSNDTPTATVLSNKKFAILKTNPQENETLFNSFSSEDGSNFRAQINWIGENASLLFSILGKELNTFSMARFLFKTVWKRGVQNIMQLSGKLIASVRNDFPNYFKSHEVNALLCPWILHTGLSPESPFSATMAKIIAFTVELVGLPLVKGGSFKIVEAFENIIKKNGSSCIVNSHVEEIIIEDKTAVGVIMANGIKYYGKHVVASTAPQQLYGSLIKNKSVIPKEVELQAENYRFGMGNMQIHLILNEAPKWYNNELSTVTYIHFSDGIDDVSRSINQAKRQMLPNNPTICVAQPTAIDPTRSSDGKHVLWIQLPECPNYPKGDSYGELDTLCNEEWTEELKNLYADRIINDISQYITNIKTANIYRNVISPKDLSELNINLKHGDPYCGACNIDQYLLWRPLKSVKNHETPIKNLFHSGASTHPGPGLGGGSGLLIANKLMKK